MNKVLSRVSQAVAGATGAVLTAGAAMADPIIDVSTMTPDVSMVGTLGAAICVGLLGIWGVRKVIKLINRS